VIDVMAKRINTQATVAAGGAPLSFTLLGAPANLTGAGAFVESNNFGGIGLEIVNDQRGTANDRGVKADFYRAMKELILLSYCNPIKVIDEVIPQCIQFERKNIYLSIASLPNMTPGLKVRDKKNKNQWSVATKTAMKIPEVIYCAELGRVRFDTKLVRNLTWFVQLQRVMRVVLTNHLSWINSPVVRGLKIADANMTELHGNDGYEPNEFNGKSYKGQI
jgi:hypothetical protein